MAAWRTRRSSRTSTRRSRTSSPPPPISRSRVPSPIPRSCGPTSTPTPEGARFMPIEVLMPALSPTMTEGKIAKWLKKPGDAVKAGDILAEIETDKAMMEMEAADEGTFAKILVPEGTENVAVNLPIALIAGEGEDVAAVEKAEAPKAAGTAPAPKPSTPTQEAPVEQVAEAKPPKPAPQPAAQPKRAPAPAEKEWTGPTVTLTVR